MYNLTNFRFWCQKVLPLVYDDSLSYYEVLCKVVDYINHMIDNQKEFADDLGDLKSELGVVQKWISDFEPNIVNEIIEKYIVAGIYVKINEAGYFVISRPESWRNIWFGTTGYDMETPCQTNYGHLVMMY